MPGFKHDLRRIRFVDLTTKKEYEFFTNNLELSAGTIAEIYKHRWQIELFFKWIKQHLKIKSFLGTSKNAVMTQIWIAMIYYLMLCYLKYKARMTETLLSLTRVIQELIFERIPLIHIINLPTNKLPTLKKILDPPQLLLF